MPAPALVPFTAGSCVAVWATWPALHPTSATDAANPQDASAAVMIGVRRFKGFTGASCSADEAA
ncbi:GJ16787 [Mycobacterium sp. PO1]|nr:GJ16787 [Mycobacterium sp. PO1]GFM21691.1 GJ16787 [Mycobacterium sp. PO2]